MNRGIFIFTLFFLQSGVAQTVWKAELPVVEKSNYYHIELNPELIGAGLEHLKITDENNNDVPYFIRSDNPIREIADFESYDLKNNTTKDSLNSIIVDNKTLENLKSFLYYSSACRNEKIYLYKRQQRSETMVCSKATERRAGFFETAGGKHGNVNH